MPISRAVTVEQLPEITSEEHGRRYLRMVLDRMSDRRPGLVLDCSNLAQLDRPAVHVILSCLEEAMKRNGDARLAGVSPSAQAILKAVGADRLFQIFASNADAVSSFHQNSFALTSFDYSRNTETEVAENAA